MPAPETVRQLVRRFEENLDLYRSSRYNEKQLASTPQDKDRVKREIETTKKAIDRLVYELHGLTEDEIKVVEGK